MIANPLILAGTAATLLLATAAPAQNLVKNGDFTDTTVTRSEQFTDTGVANWSNTRNGGWTGWGYNFLIRDGDADSNGFWSLGSQNHDYLWGPNGAQGRNYADNGLSRSPTGGNYILGDGEDGFRGAITQTIGGLVAGQTYRVSFDWGAVSYYDKQAPTHDHWDVSLGGSAVQSTPDVTLDPRGFSGWRSSSFDFVANGTSQVLSFLAQGGPSGQPPSLLLDNVAMVAVPEPATWATMLLGFGLIGVASRRRSRVRAIA